MHTAWPIVPPYLSRFFRCVKLCWSASLLFQWKQFQHIRALVCFWVENCNLSCFFCSHCYTVQYTKLSKKFVISRERERHLFFSKSYNQQKNSHGSECVSKFEIMCNGAKKLWSGNWFFELFKVFQWKNNTSIFVICDVEKVRDC